MYDWNKIHPCTIYKIYILLRTMQNSLIQKSVTKQMGYYYNQLCHDQSCSALCCNTHGTCPDHSYSSTSYNQCQHYYTYHTDTTTCSAATGESSVCCYSNQSGYYPCNKSGTTVAGVIGGIVGTFVGLVVLIVVIVCVCRRYRYHRVPTVPVNAGNKTIVILDGGSNFGYHPYTYAPSYVPTNPNTIPPYISTTNAYPQK